MKSKGGSGQTLSLIHPLRLQPDPPSRPLSVLLRGAITAPLIHHRRDHPPSPAPNQRGPSQRKERKGSKPSSSGLPSSPTSTHLR
ncbi:hypothetical protein U1Q18_032510, partial [Sarracenia purpurea var. burkii]